MRIWLLCVILRGVCWIPKVAGAGALPTAEHVRPKQTILQTSVRSISNSTAWRSVCVWDGEHDWCHKTRLHMAYYTQFDRCWSRGTSTQYGHPSEEWTLIARLSTSLNVIDCYTVCSRICDSLL